ncbi:group II intron maturase-specific domain-containing protein [Streptomyces sp. NPDC014735]|uniref:group II intron maturase-specific domain-containing protein n=1 Tax=unclassified Streptomyces TaxID=2593676 RepID=UPI00370092A8
MRSWQLHTRSDLSFNELARWINPVVSGWLNYYGRFRPWELHPFVMRINAYLVRWIRQKYKPAQGQAEGPREDAGDRSSIPPHVRALAPHRDRECRGGLMIRATRAV